MGFDKPGTGRGRIPTPEGTGGAAHSRKARPVDQQLVEQATQSGAVAVGVGQDAGARRPARAPGRWQSGGRRVRPATGRGRRGNR